MRETFHSVLFLIPAALSGSLYLTVQREGWPTENVWAVRPISQATYSCIILRNSIARRVNCDIVLLSSLAAVVMEYFGPV